MPGAPSKRDQMEQMADSTAHQMATMHPDFQRLKDGMKKQIKGMMGQVASRSSGPRFRKGGYDGATKGKGLKRG